MIPSRTARRQGDVRKSLPALVCTKIALERLRGQEMMSVCALVARVQERRQLTIVQNTLL